MRVQVNGEARDVPEGISVRGLLDHLEIRAETVAIERNLEILPRNHWELTRVEPDDRYEIVHMVGGG